MKKLVFNLGSDAGFYSEFNNMVLAILFCLKHNIEFILYSKNAKFRYKRGWTDYFQPFCKEVRCSLHNKFNPRFPVPDYAHSQKYWIASDIFKKINNFDYYTYELWNSFHNRQFSKESFVINNQLLDIHDASQYVIKKIYKFNQETSININQIVNSINLPTRYVGMHIRGGDKILESKIANVSSYMNKLQQFTPIKDIFVFTDDYKFFQTLNSNYPDYSFYTLSTESDTGYCHNEFVKQNTDVRKHKIIKLLASVDILCKSDCCIGTFSSNIGMYLGMVMPKGKMIGIDYDDWLVW